MMVKRIFLDSRDWITLARIANGKERNPVLIKVYQKIRKLSDSGKAVFPFSMFHLDDIIKNTNKKQRETVIDIMIEVSKGLVMKPFLLYREKEIENAILRKIGFKSIHDIKSQIIGRGIAYTAGEEYRISSTNPEIQKFLDGKNQELRNLIDSTQSMAKILKDDDFSSFVRRDHQLYIVAAQEMEKNRKQRRTWKKTERYNNELRSYFSNYVVPHLVKFLQENGIRINAARLFRTKKDLELFLEYMPSSNTFVRLTYARDEESSERVIQPNDLIDVCHLAGAVPYCDIVVMEKMFASLCRKVKLDKKYGCIVLSSLQDLNEITYCRGR